MDISNVILTPRMQGKAKYWRWRTIQEASKGAHIWVPCENKDHANRVRADLEKEASEQTVDFRTPNIKLSWPNENEKL